MFYIFILASAKAIRLLSDHSTTYKSIMCSSQTDVSSCECVCVCLQQQLLSIKIRLHSHRLWPFQFSRRTAQSFVDEVEVYFFPSLLLLPLLGSHSSARRWTDKALIDSSRGKQSVMRHEVQQHPHTHTHTHYRHYISSSHTYLFFSFDRFVDVLLLLLVVLRHCHWICRSIFISI